jgi:hypothetical protein
MTNINDLIAETACPKLASRASLAFKTWARESTVPGSPSRMPGNRPISKNPHAVAVPLQNPSVQGIYDTTTPPCSTGQRNHQSRSTA